MCGSFPSLTEKRRLIAASVQAIASPFGALLSGFLMERWGRRTTLILCTIPFTASWIALAFATRHAVILTARAMAGFASGLTIGPTQVCTLLAEL